MKYSILLALLMNMTAFATTADKELNSIYRLFMQQPLNIENVELRYTDNIVHVNKANQPLLSGKENFLATNITPMVSMLASGNIKLQLKAYIARRVVTKEMANDVGYIYMKMTTEDGNIMEQLNKFSWVFLKQDGLWKVLTDFDTVPAPMSVLDDSNKFIVID